MCGGDTGRTGTETGGSERRFEDRRSGHAEPCWLPAVVDPAANTDEFTVEHPTPQRRLNGAVGAIKVLATEERT